MILSLNAENTTDIECEKCRCLRVIGTTKKYWQQSERVEIVLDVFPYWKEDLKI